MPVLTRRLLALFLFLCGCIAVSLAARLVVHQVTAVRDVREVSAPLLAELPTLERRRELLLQQRELAELQSALRTGSIREKIRVYVLPTVVDLDRLATLFDVLALLLEREAGMPVLTDVSFGAEVPVESGLHAVPIFLRFRLQESDLPVILSPLRLAGIVTVGDALTEEDRHLLLARSEEESPTGIVALEQFLSLDVLDYALEPVPHERQLLASLPGTRFREAFDHVRATSLLGDLQTLLTSDIGQSLQSQNLWPMPLLTLEQAELAQTEQAGWLEVSLTVHTYRRD